MVTTDEKALLKAIDEGDDSALYALADLIEEQGGDASGLRWVIDNQRRPFTSTNGYAYSWIIEGYYHPDDNPQAVLPDWLFEKLDESLCDWLDKPMSGHRPRTKAFLALCQR